MFNKNKFEKAKKEAKKKAQKEAKKKAKQLASATGKKDHGTLVKILKGAFGMFVVVPMASFIFVSMSLFITKCLVDGIADDKDSIL